jgi:hypothetical protein
MDGKDFVVGEPEGSTPQFGLIKMRELLREGRWRLIRRAAASAAREGPVGDGRGFFW